MRFIVWRVVVSVIAISLLDGLTAAAQDFRIDNKAFAAGQPQPIESTTLFAAGKAYDFLEASQETIVFDKTANSLVILDLANKTKAEISTGDVSTDVGRLREAARSSQTESTRMSASPRFEQSVDLRTGQLTFNSKWTRYVVSTESPQNAGVAAQYHEFAEWLIQLDALLNPPKLPFARLKLHETLKNLREIPIQIELTSRSQGQAKTFVLRSEHRIRWGLSAADQVRLDAVDQQLQTFQAVPLQNFRRPPQGKAAG